MAGAKRNSHTEQDRQIPPGSAGAEQESYDETVEETFPASDPPAASGITGPGRGRQVPQEKRRGN